MKSRLLIILGLIIISAPFPYAQDRIVQIPRSSMESGVENDKTAYSTSSATAEEFTGKYDNRIGSPRYYYQPWRHRNFLEGIQHLPAGKKEIVVAFIGEGVNYDLYPFPGNLWINEKEQNGKKGVDDDKNGLVDDIYGIDGWAGDSDPFESWGLGTIMGSQILAACNYSQDYTQDYLNENGNVKLMILRDAVSDLVSYSINIDGLIECFKYARQMKADVVVMHGGTQVSPVC